MCNKKDEYFHRAACKSIIGYFYLPQSYSRINERMMTMVSSRLSFNRKIQLFKFPVH